MRSGKDLARWSQGRRSDWRRRLGAVGVVIAAALALVGSVWVVAGLYVDWLWFDSLGYGAVYRTQVASQVVLLLAGAGLFGLLYVGSLRLARRLGDAGAGVIVAGEGLWTFLARVSAGLGRDTARVRRAERTLLGLGVALALGF